MVFCDANVLYGTLLRDLLMWLGVRRSLRLRWTSQVQEEWTRNLLEHRPELTPDRLTRTCEQMNRAIPDALVESAPGEEGFDLPDPDDRHVLAAALDCGAEALLTFNLKDFPTAAVPAGLQVAHPDLYLRDYPQAVITALQKLRANLKRALPSPRKKSWLVCRELGCLSLPKRSGKATWSSEKRSSK